MIPKDLPASTFFIATPGTLTHSMISCRDSFPVSFIPHQRLKLTTMIKAKVSRVRRELILIEKELSRPIADVHCTMGSKVLQVSQGTCWMSWDILDHFRCRSCGQYYIWCCSSYMGKCFGRGEELEIGDSDCIPIIGSHIEEDNIAGRAKYSSMIELLLEYVQNRSRLIWRARRRAEIGVWME